MIEKNPHAEAQERYIKKKKKKNVRLCVWIPKGRGEEFRKAIDRLNKKWAKE